MYKLFSDISLSRRRTLDLLNHVIIPTIKDIESQLSSCGYKITRAHEADAIHLLSLYAISVIYKPEKSNTFLKNFIQKYCRKKKLSTSCKNIWQHFSNALLDWLKLSEFNRPYYTQMALRVEEIPDWETIQTEYCQPTNEEATQANHTEGATHEENFEDTFWVEESDTQSSEINLLHTSDVHSHVMSAQEFMANSDLDSGYLQDLHDELEDIYNVLELAHSFDVDLAERFAHNLSKLSSTLHHSIEFEPLATVLDHLTHLVKNLAPKLDASQGEVLLLLLKQLVQDLIVWFDHIFITKSAIDIHYLDAALLASISQIEIMFEADESPEHPSDEEGDFMLF